jgi:acetyl-CoA carboxylase carboxyl transferase subunit alpha
LVIKKAEIREKFRRNFGMPNPEGYRKALRLMEMAERFKLPIFTFIDTPGAYPGIEAEERGQSEAIARNLAVMSRLKSTDYCYGGWRRWFRWCVSDWCGRCAC